MSVGNALRALFYVSGNSSMGKPDPIDFIAARTAGYIDPANRVLMPGTKKYNEVVHNQESFWRSASHEGRTKRRKGRLSNTSINNRAHIIMYNKYSRNSRKISFEFGKNHNWVSDGRFDILVHMDKDDNDNIDYSKPPMIKFSHKADGFKVSVLPSGIYNISYSVRELVDPLIGFFNEVRRRDLIRITLPIPEEEDSVIYRMVLD